MAFAPKKSICSRLACLYQSQQHLAEVDQLLQTGNPHLKAIGEMVLLETIRTLQVELALDQNKVYFNRFCVVLH